ncbi:MAG: hypothetical protein RLZZ237_3992, partial [Pseudomonadota bacterium]
FPDVASDKKIPHDFKHVNYLLPTGIVRLKNVLFKTLLSRKKSIQESLFFSVDILKSLQQAIDQVDADLIVFDTIRMGQYFPLLKIGKAKSVLYLEDLFSVRYKSMIRALQLPETKSFNPLGNFERHVPKMFQPYIKKFSFLQKMLLSYESKLVENSEASQARIFPDNLLINRSEADLLSSWGGRGVHVFPPYVSSTVRPYSRTWKGRPVFVFLGGLDVPHNAVSLEDFIDAHLPSIIKDIPDVLIRVIGKNPAPSLLELVKKFPDSVHIEGYVDSLNEVLHEACAMLVPLLFGSGVKLKTIDALSYGLPIIATDFGVEGVGVSTGNRDCIVENDLSKYGAWMKKLLDLQFNQELSRNSYNLYIDNYSDKSVRNQYSKIFDM